MTIHLKFRASLSHQKLCAASFTAHALDRLHVVHLPLCLLARQPLAITVVMMA